MMKRLILSFFLLLSLSLQAQTEKRDSLMNDNIEADSLTSVRPSAFKRAIKKFMNFSDFDTLYISPNRYNYALMATHFSNFEYYSVSSDLPQPQKLSFSPNPHNKIGLYFGWRWIFLGWSVDVDDIYRKTNRKNKGTEFDLSLYSSKLGVDIFYRRTGNNYKIHKIRGFYDEIPSNYSENFNGLKVDIKGLNLYYIFNNRKFSYPAAFSQSTNQRRNAGTFIAGFSISKHNLDFDYEELPEYIQEKMNPGMKVNKIKYTNANISFGYAYNWESAPKSRIPEEKKVQTKNLMCMERTTGTRTGRKPKSDPADRKYSFRLNAEENTRFEKLLADSGAGDRTLFIKKSIFSGQIKVVRIDKATMDYYIKLTEFHKQFQAVGNNYNQVVRALKNNFGEKRAMALLYKLEKLSIELMLVCKKVMALTQEYERKWLQK